MHSKPVMARVMLLLTIMVVGLNLRPFMTSVGPLAASIQADTGLGLQGLALLTLLPMFVMGLLAFSSSVLQGKGWDRRAVVGALLLICLGCVWRLFVSTSAALIATAAVIGLGVAVVQIIFPGMVKREFPRHVGPVMGLYSALLMGGGAMGAVVAPMVYDATGSWTAGLACFALPAALAVCLSGLFLPPDRAVPHGPARLPIGALLKRPRTWLLMLCFGLVNGGYSSAVAWLAPAFRARGWSATSSGELLAVLAVGQALAALLLPMLARTGMDRRPWLGLTLALQIIGFMGLAAWPETLPMVWVMLLGIGLGGCFAFFLILALEHLPDPVQAGTLAALMQGGGFILAAVAPWWVAVLHEGTGSYLAGWLWHLGCALLVMCLSWRLGPGGYARAIGLPGVAR